MVGHVVELLRVALAFLCIEMEEPGAALVLEFIQILYDADVTGAFLSL